jgi:phosphoserine phosphatase RsbU/P
MSNRNGTAFPDARSPVPEASGQTLVDPAEPPIAELQRHLLPQALPQVDGYEFAAVYRPCEEAGGDFYGFQAFADGRLGMAVADIAGHGSPAAVMMAALRGAQAAFRVFGRPRETAPQDINSVIYEIAVPGMFITAFFVSLDPRTGTLYCGNCGHPPAIIVKPSGRHEVIDAAGDLPLGIVPTINPPMMTVALDVGDTLVLYTDGVTEMRNPAGEEFGRQRLIAVVSEADGQPAQSVCDAIVRALRSHHGEAPLADDHCVLICRRIPA